MIQPFLQISLGDFLLCRSQTAMERVVVTGATHLTTLEFSDCPKDVSPLYLSYRSKHKVSEIKYTLDILCDRMIDSHLKGSSCINLLIFYCLT